MLKILHVAIKFYMIASLIWKKIDVLPLFLHVGVEKTGIGFTYTNLSNTEGGRYEKRKVTIIEKSSKIY